MAKKSDKDDDDKPKVFLGVGATGDPEHPDEGSEAFGVAAEPTVEQLAPEVQEDKK